MDIASSSSSYGEGFPNVVGEAMSCEVPCVVTDVGDSAYIVGNTGRVVPVKNPDVLAKAWLELIKMKAAKRRELGAAARKRIINSFDLKDIVLRYEDMYKAIFNM